MGLFDKAREPVFLKESSDAHRQLEVLKQLEPQLTPKGQERLRQDIRYLEYGIQGEEQIAFELRNSHMRLFVLHDIYLEDGDLNAQIDYLVFTRKLCFVIECKNLYGDIEINSSGDFIRTLSFNGKKKKEGLYSPITQNQRHLELMKKLKLESRTNILTKHIAEKVFDSSYRSIVVLANPKTVLNARYAKKEVKQKVIRADQLAAYIKEQHQLSKEVEMFDSDARTWAESFLKLHKEVERDYTKKYESFMIQKSVPRCEMDSESRGEDESKTEDSGERAISFDAQGTAEQKEKVEDTELFKALKAYRWKKSREENIKPYFIYNDNQLRDLIGKMPQNKQDLQNVSGFGAVKSEKYGEDILEILKQYKN